MRALGTGVLVACAAVAPAAAQTYTERYAQHCAACHGAAGRSEIALTPSLGGQPSFYAITQLFLFRQGRRDNEAMVAVAKGMSDDDLRGYSDAVAKLPPPAAPASAPDPKRVARGHEAAQRHRCGACHGADYIGGQQVARLARQREDYVAHTLRGFKSGQRIGYTNAMNEAMSGVAAGEIDDLAHYLAHLPAR